MVTVRRGVALLWLVLSLPPLTLAASVTGSNPHAGKFKVFDGTLYRNKPKLDRYGIEPIEILYAARFWPDTRSSQRMERLPDEHRVRLVGRDLRAGRKPVVIDIEHWPLEGDEAQMRVNQAKYITVLQWLRSEAPGLNIGYFGRLPGVAYHWSLEDKESQHYRLWQHENARLDDFSALVDTIYLPLYTYYPDRAAWVKYATAHLHEARRYGKPVYVFLWPQYSERNKSLGQQYLPEEYWRLQLETVRKYADGVVIWGGWDGKRHGPALWDSAAPWWQVTREFMRVSLPEGEAALLSE
jgi:hypothetical protein